MGTKIGLRSDRLQQLRERQGLSQRELARRCGFSEALIRKYEMAGSDPAGHFIKVLAEQLGVSTDYLLGVTDDPNGHLGDGQFGDDERAVLETFRREGWPGVIRLGAEKISR